MSNKQIEMIYFIFLFYINTTVLKHQPQSHNDEIQFKIPSS